jgi:O-antigen ligase
VDLLIGRLFEGNQGDRLGLAMGGTVSNANDYAAHLLLVLPFLLWAGFSARRRLIRLAAVAGVGIGVLLILKTASRGAALALALTVVVYLVKATPGRRMGVLLLAPVGLAALLLVVPQNAWRRIGSLSSASASSVQEAVESSRAREYLLKKSLEYTLKFPIFGVGPGQFASYEGGHNVVIGVHGSWHATHNTLTQVSSECGIPALLFFVAGVISTFRAFSRCYKATQGRDDCREVADACFCAMLAIVGFCAATLFLSFAYAFYLPAMAGLSIAVTSAAGANTERDQAAQAGKCRVAGAGLMNAPAR